MLFFVMAGVIFKSILNIASQALSGKNVSCYLYVI